ncbi:oligosaccharide flippase family protein [Pseudoroseicyclus sp. CXY001]|uniref:oligosaccharide flippase family protein n=1 Tax=Pseudoroseicyclus sp. CXY001 TaxID=3242492 RepID=UPI003570E569
MSALARRFRGSGLMQRAARTSVQAMTAYGAGQAMRLASNLILTRLLFPEAFGIMGMVMVVLVGLQQFSDLGVGAAIMQSKRGDDAAFLDTAWTLHVLRGVGLWLVACALALPAAAYFNTPEVARYMPIMGLALVIDGFLPTRREQAGRHMRIGRLTAIEIGGQATGIALTVALAAATGSIWALVAAPIVASAVNLAFLTVFLPGRRNRPGLERAALGELISFGKWIFLSTIAGYLVLQGDRLVLGRSLPAETFGLYNIAAFLATFPLLLSLAVARRIMIPLYRESPPAAGAENFARLARARAALSLVMAGGALLLAAVAIPLVGVLYDPRYAPVGELATLIALAQVPAILCMSYDEAALAAGDSRAYASVTIVRAVLCLAGLGFGFSAGGVIGALFGYAAAQAATWPASILVARRYKTWDPRHDALGALAWIGLGAAILIWRWPEIAELARFAGPG